MVITRSARPTERKGHKNQEKKMTVSFRVPFIATTRLRTCSSFLDNVLIIRSSSASYALMRSSSRLLLVDSLRGAGEDDDDEVGDNTKDSKLLIRAGGSLVGILGIAGAGLTVCYLRERETEGAFLVLRMVVMVVVREKGVSPRTTGLWEKER